MKYDKIYVIGDIHGSIDMLNRIMDIIPWRANKDLIIFLGDYIDRGEHSKEVIDYIINLKRYSQNVKCILGNHEKMFLDYLNGNIDERFFFINGGGMTLSSYGITNPKEGFSLVPEEHILFLNRSNHILSLRIITLCTLASNQELE